MLAKNDELLCEKIGIDLADTIAFGDEQNDLSLIENAGLGVAMGNAVPELKKAADLITCTNQDDGLSVVLEQILADSQ